MDQVLPSTAGYGELVLKRGDLFIGQEVCLLQQWKEIVRIGVWVPHSFVLCSGFMV